MSVIEYIGTPAALEQLAEEAAELAQAALKFARVLRKENPTPKTPEECIESVREEIVDVEICMQGLRGTPIWNLEKMKDLKARKEARAWERILEADRETKISREQAERILTIRGPEEAGQLRSDEPEPMTIGGISIAPGL